MDKEILGFIGLVMVLASVITIGIVTLLEFKFDRIPYLIGAILFTIGLPLMIVGL